MKKSSSLSSVRNLVLFVTFLFYLFIASQIPYTQDDWNWGIDAGIRSFITADQNSRYAGNLLVLLLTRSATLKNIVMAAVFTVIPYMMVRIIDITEEREFWVMYLLANVLILIMPVTVWRQTYGWVSGFANFVASMPFVCGHILILKKYLFNQCDSETVQFQAGRSVMLFAFSLIGQLFFENATVYFTAVYLCANAFFIVRCRKIHPYLFTAFVGTCIGAAIMFSSSLYDTLVSTGTAYEGYRELTVDLDGGVPGIVGSIIHSFCYQSAQQVTVEFYPQTILILLCMTYFLIMRKTKFSVLLALGNVGMGAIYAVVWGAGIFVPYRYKIAFGLFYFLTIFTEYIYIYIYIYTKKVVFQLRLCGFQCMA